MLLTALFIVLVVAIFSDNPAGARFRSLLEGLARRFPRTTGGRIALALAAALVLAGLIQLLKTEAVGIAAPMLPDLMTWFALIDIGTAMDVVALAVLTAMTVRLKAVLAAVRSLGASMRRRWIAERERTPRRPRRPKADDDERRPLAPAPGGAVFA